MTNYYNRLWTKHLNLNLDNMHISNVRMHRLILDKFYTDDESKQSYVWPTSPLSTKVFWNYNVFLYPHAEYYELFNEIKTMFYEIAKPTEPHYIQAWLNVYEAGQYLAWHKHCDDKDKEDACWHGFYCADVETEPSQTLYKLSTFTEDVVKIDSSNNLLVMGRAGHIHKTSEWHSSDNPRVTIAFNIIPRSGLNMSELKNQDGGIHREYLLNNYVPIL